MSVPRRLTTMVVLAAVTGCATAPRQPFVVGRYVEVATKTGKSEKGELLAVGPEQLWLFQHDQVKTVPASGVTRVRVWRRDVNGSHVSAFATIGALVTGGLLAGACTSVEGNDGAGCIGLGVVVAATWAVVGGISARSAEHRTRLDVATNWKALEPFARFPQGLPEGLTLRGLEGSHPVRAEDPAKSKGR
jgi:hypothetical protein